MTEIILLGMISLALIIEASVFWYFKKRIGQYPQT